MPKIYKLIARDVAFLHSLAFNKNPAAMVQKSGKILLGLPDFLSAAFLNDQILTERENTNGQR